MTNFKTQEMPGEKLYRLQFETEDRENFLKVQETARACMDKNPPQTMAERLFRAFPGAIKNRQGLPDICPYEIGLMDEPDWEYCGKTDCRDCWGQRV